MSTIVAWLSRNFGKLLVYGFIFGVLGIFVLMQLARFPETQTRTRHTRVKADMRILGAALESYHAQHGGFPAMHPLDGLATLDGEALKAAALEGLSGLPPGIAPAPLLDPFSPGKSLSYAYHTDGSGWMLISPGPDGVYEFHPEREAGLSYAFGDPARVEMTYDPTNGSFSRGEVFRTSDSARREREWANQHGAAR